MRHVAPHQICFLNIQPPGFTQTRRHSARCTTCVWLRHQDHSRNFPSSVLMVSSVQHLCSSSLHLIIIINQAPYSTRRSWSVMVGSTLTVPRTPSPTTSPRWTFSMPREPSSPSGWSLTSQRKIIPGDLEVESR